MESGKEEKEARRSLSGGSGGGSGYDFSTTWPRSKSNRIMQKAVTHRRSAAGSGVAAPGSELDPIPFIGEIVSSKLARFDWMEGIETSIDLNY